MTMNMSTTNTILTQFDALAQIPYLSEIVAQVRGIWERHGSPELPSGTTSTDCAQPIPGPVEATDVGDWDGHEEQAADKLTGYYEDLAELIDVRGCYGSASTTYGGRDDVDGGYSDGWADYEEDAREALTDWASNVSWERFCHFFEDGVGESTPADLATSTETEK